MLSEDGTVAQLASGELLVAGDHAGALLICEDHERRRNCSLDLIEIATGDRHRIQQPAAGTWTGVNAADVPRDIPPWPATTADGRIMAGFTSGDGPEKVETHLVAIDPERGSIALLHRLDGWPRPATWDPRGEHIVLADGPDLTVIGLSDRALFTLRDIIPSGHHVVGMR